MINKFVSRSVYPVSEEVWKEHVNDPPLKP